MHGCEAQRYVMLTAYAYSVIGEDSVLGEEMSDTSSKHGSTTT